MNAQFLSRSYHLFFPNYPLHRYIALSLSQFVSNPLFSTFTIQSHIEAFIELDDDHYVSALSFQEREQDERSKKEKIVSSQTIII